MADTYDLEGYWETIRPGWKPEKPKVAPNWSTIPTPFQPNSLSVQLSRLLLNKHHVRHLERNSVGSVTLTDELVPVPDIPLTSVREGVEVEPVPCGKCGRLTVSRIESPDGVHWE